MFFFCLSVDEPITVGVGACNTVEGLLAAVYGIFYRGTVEEQTE